MESVNSPFSFQSFTSGVRFSQSMEKVSLPNSHCFKVFLHKLSLSVFGRIQSDILSATFDFLNLELASASHICFAQIPFNCIVFLPSGHIAGCIRFCKIICLKLAQTSLLLVLQSFSELRSTPFVLDLATQTSDYSAVAWSCRDCCGPLWHVPNCVFLFVMNYLSLKASLLQAHARPRSFIPISGFGASDAIWFFRLDAILFFRFPSSWVFQYGVVFVSSTVPLLGLFSRQQLILIT